MMASSMRRALLLSSFLLLAAAGCEDRPEFRGGGCDLTSDCDDFLICVFGRCRRECRDEVDCALGLQCLNDSTSGRGCQLPDELMCERDDDCGELVCREGECGQECDESLPCVDGSQCVTTAGVSTCEPLTEELCIYASDCAPGLVCNAYQRCVLECREDRDCDAPRICETRDVEGFPTPLCVLPASFADGGP